MKTPDFIEELTHQVDPASAIRNLAIFTRNLNERVTELETQNEAATRVVLCLAAQMGIVDQETAVAALRAEGVTVHLGAVIHEKEDGTMVLEIRITKRQIEKGEPEKEPEPEPETEGPNPEPEPPDRPLRQKLPCHLSGRPKG